MKTVHKYTIQPGINEFELPVGARVLHLGSQHGEARMWVLVDPERETERRVFAAYQTGEPIEEESLTHVGTVRVPGEIVAHVFELPGVPTKQDDQYASSILDRLA